MKCPNCGEQMDREDYEIGVTRSGEASQMVDTIVGHRPMADYLCGGCGSEFRWTRGSGLRVIYDSYGDASCGLRERCALLGMDD